MRTRTGAARQLHRKGTNMPNLRGLRRHSLANTQKLTIIAQDPSVRVGGKILVTEVDVPAEELLSGPSG